MIEKNLASIEQARKQLNALVKKYNNDFQHPVVIKQSMLLDELINQYSRTGKQKEKPIV
ncbi:aspartyl-phosphate phosphatase Spo0E family protein [Paenibacillus sp. An7]|uniref:aspartyl-phosphate phosphatase Spo0E family protein n=1 Tax=Paenibacillus sp. An7 TaxID=2689577 RepID=UPI001357D4A6|nr:aspartyl-phosphate phosphatase Spo0E family protein [Paenibacillus sp. An7]